MNTRCVFVFEDGTRCGKVANNWVHIERRCKDVSTCLHHPFDDDELTAFVQEVHKKCQNSKNSK